MNIQYYKNVTHNHSTVNENRELISAFLFILTTWAAKWLTMQYKETIPDTLIAANNTTNVHSVSDQKRLVSLKWSMRVRLIASASLLQEL